ncbi:MAG: NfeD family protein [Flavobacteriales bacterium]|nr:NfeD family protein [Flavobacteriales bacterium]
MDFFQWHWWAGAAILLLIAEIFVPGFFLVCLGIGCAGASIAAAVGGGPGFQLLAFSILALVAFFTIRPLLMKQFWKENGVKTNVDALIGQRGKVTQDFEAGLRLGRVSVGGDDWRAESINDKPIHAGDLVKIVRVDSNTLIVKPLEHGHSAEA